MENNKPIYYRIEDSFETAIGIAKNLVELVESIKKKGYYNPEELNIYAIYSDDWEQQIPPIFYSCRRYHTKRKAEVAIWYNQKALSAAEKKISRQINKYNDYQRMRICFKCRKILYFREFHSANSSLDYDRAFSLWEHPNIELFCCSCFRELSML